MARRRQALQDAALELFVAKGYESTTVEEIATRAGVSRRTFFHYFGAKEEVLFSPNPLWLEDIEQLILDQLPGLGDLEVVRRAYLQWFVPSDRERVRHMSAALLRRAMSSSATLMGHYYRSHLANIDGVAQGLARRRGLPEPDAPAVLAATVGQTLLRTATDRWMQDDRAAIRELIAEEFARLGDLVGDVVAALGPEHPA